MYFMFLAEGFEETEALCPLDLMRRAGIDVRTVGIGGDIITGAHGITVKADMADTDFNFSVGCDGVILPGGMPGTTNLGKSGTVKDALARTYSEGGLLAAICAAPSVLGSNGYLTGKKAVCFPGFEDKLIGAIYTGKRVETDGSIITAAGMGVAYEFGLALVSYIKGHDTARKLAGSALIPDGMC